MTNPNRLALALVVALAAGCSSTPPAKEPSSEGPGAEPAKTESSADAELAEAEAAAKANDGEKTKKAAEAALAKAPKNAKAMFFAGVGADLLGDRDGAEKRFREALAVQPGFVDAAANLSVILLDTKREAEAVKLLKPLAEKAPDDPLVQNNYAAALSLTGDHEKAAAIYEKLVAKGDKRPETRLGWAGELFESNKKEQAQKVLRDGIAGLGDNRDLLAAWARALAKVGAHDDAIKTLDKAIAIKASPDLLTYRALFQRSSATKDLAKIKADLEAAIKLDGKFAQAHFYLGEVLDEMKKPADAKKAYEEVVKLAPDSPHGKKAKERIEGGKGKK